MPHRGFEISFRNEKWEIPGGVVRSCSTYREWLVGNSDLGWDGDIVSLPDADVHASCFDGGGTGCNGEVDEQRRKSGYLQ